MKFNNLLYKHQIKCPGHVSFVFFTEPNKLPPKKKVRETPKSSKKLHKPPLCPGGSGDEDSWEVESGPLVTLVPGFSMG